MKQFTESGLELPDPDDEGCTILWNLTDRALLKTWNFSTLLWQPPIMPFFPIIFSCIL